MTTNTLQQPAIQDRTNRAQADRNEKQYSIAGILWVWALASLPCGLLFWLGLPVLDRITEISVSYLVLIVTVIPYFWHLLLVCLILKGKVVI